VKHHKSFILAASSPVTFQPVLFKLDTSTIGVTQSGVRPQESSNMNNHPYLAQNQEVAFVSGEKKPQGQNHKGLWTRLRACRWEGGSGVGDFSDKKNQRFL
jgi:hypothetical protein